MIAVNLLPWRQSRMQRQRRIFIAGAACMTLILALFAALQQRSLIYAALQAEAEQQRVRGDITGLTQKLQRQRELQQQTEVRQRRQQRLQEKKAMLLRWHLFWHELPVLLPRSLWLQKLEKRNAQLFVEGRAYDMQAISEFRQKLGAQRLFSDIKQGSVKRLSAGDYLFSFRGRIDEASDE